MPGGESAAIGASVGLMRSTLPRRSAVLADVLRASQRSAERKSIGMPWLWPDAFGDTSSPTPRYRLPSESKSRPAPPTWPGPESVGPPGKPDGEPPILFLGTRRITRSESGTTALPSAFKVKRLIWLYPTTCTLPEVGQAGLRGE